MQEEIDLARGRDPLRDTCEGRDAARVRVRALLIEPGRVVDLGRELALVGEIARRPIHLHCRDGTGSVAERAGGVGGQPERAEGAGGQRRSAAERVVAGRSRHELRRSAQGPGAELRAEDAPADDDAIEQRRRKRREIDGASAGTLQGDPVEQDRGLVGASSAQRERRRLARSAERVHRDARRGCEHLRVGDTERPGVGPVAPPLEDLACAAVPRGAQL